MLANLQVCVSLCVVALLGMVLCIAGCHIVHATAMGTWFVCAGRCVVCGLVLCASV